VLQRSFIPGALTVASAAFFLFAGVPGIASAQISDEAQIRALEHRFAEAFKAKDVDAIMANYEHSPALVAFDVVPRREYTGWDAYKHDWRQFFASIGSITSFEIEDLVITADGNLAYSHSFQHYASEAKDGKGRDLTVRVTDVYRKSGGQWLIVQEHVSVPVDLRTGQADLQFRP
jgi:ketosteroid isomerase-like protein